MLLATYDHTVAARHAVEHCAGDVRDEITERIDFDHFTFDAIWHLLHLRPRYFDELFLRPAQLIGRKTQAEPGRDRRHDIAPVKSARHLRHPVPGLFDADY